ncbi:16S rRNA (guanine(527)-N(7))-methyltransferase RsmG [Candidatus Phytoplasma ziziphi]|uniref:Ribosomal RNA small subunit methyltransferase G n=2 Tax=Ziziphus jujuba witches'-broom phytoplasma TaxID=135727 RepID=A0A660HND6_ZIZJU|nr:16S rRNA (guanine(527)-N(7))-methyltransferase RsmG [Candidatus Phytoplasma ziziphi]
MPFDRLKKDFALSDFQLNQFQEYYLFLTHYNKKTNLTSLTNPKDIYFKHFYDSLLISKTFNFEQINSLCDLGTGAGFPGIPLKILYPNLKVFLIDSSLKKINFLELLIKHLHLTNVFVFKEKIEKHKNKYDFVIARALGKLNLILKLASFVTKDKSYFMAMKGPNYKEEFQDITQMYQFELKNKFFLQLPEEYGKRVNLLFQKK